jgi:hypothetical protein
MDLRNLDNKLTCLNFFIQKMDKIAIKNGGKVSIIDVWDVESMLEKKHGLNERQSELIAELAININKNL